MSQGAAIRRRKQWAKQHRHMAPLRRPRYANISAAKARKRLQRQLETLRRMQNKAKK